MDRGNEDKGALGGKRFLRFSLSAFGLVAALLLVGWLPTLKLGGEVAVQAMLMGCCLSLVSSWVGMIPLAVMAGNDPKWVVPAALGSIAVRLVVLIALTTVVALSGLFVSIPFLLWVGISHIALLVVDTLFARTWLLAV